MEHKIMKIKVILALLVLVCTTVPLASAVDKIYIQPSLGVVTPQQFTGATADAQIAACFAAGPICDASGYGATTQITGATINVGAGKTLIVNYATTWQASTSSQNMIVVEPGGHVKGGFHFDCTNQPLYSGLVFSNDPIAHYGFGSSTTISDVFVSCSNDTTGGDFLNLTASGTVPVYAIAVDNVIVNGLLNGEHLVSSSSNGINSNIFTRTQHNGTVYAQHLTNNTGGIIYGNFWTNLADEQGTNGVNGILCDGTAQASIKMNQFNGDLWDYSATAPIVFGSSVGNTFTGMYNGTATGIAGNTVVNLYTNTMSPGGSFPNAYNLQWLDDAGTAQSVLTTSGAGTVALYGYHGRHFLAAVSGASTIYDGTSPGNFGLVVGAAPSSSPVASTYTSVANLSQLPQSTHPAACSSTYNGVSAYNSAAGYPCYCNGTSWRKFDGSTACGSW